MRKAGRSTHTNIKDAIERPICLTKLGISKNSPILAERQILNLATNGSERPKGVRRESLEICETKHRRLLLCKIS